MAHLTEEHLQFFNGSYRSEGANKERLRILQTIIDNPHLTREEIGELVGLSKNAITKRIGILKKAAASQGYSPEHWKDIAGYAECHLREIQGDDKGSTD